MKFVGIRSYTYPIISGVYSSGYLYYASTGGIYKVDESTLETVGFLKNSLGIRWKSVCATSTHMYIGKIAFSLWKFYNTSIGTSYDATIQVQFSDFTLTTIEIYDLHSCVTTNTHIFVSTGFLVYKYLLSNLETYDVWFNQESEEFGNMKYVISVTYFSNRFVEYC